MTLSFNGIGAAEILLIIFALSITILLANYGKNTVFGYWGSALLGICITPLLAFVLLNYLKNKSTN